MKFQQSIPFSSFIHSIKESPCHANTIAIGTANEIYLVNPETLQSKACLPIKNTFELKLDQHGLWYCNDQEVGLFDIRSGSQVKSWTLPGHHSFLSFSTNSSQNILCAVSL